MEAVMRITESELLDALAAAMPESEPDAMTVPELAVAHGVAEKRLRAALKVLATAGRLRHHRVMRPTLDGRHAPVPAYTILPARTP